MSNRKKQYIIEELDPPGRSVSMNRKLSKQINSSYKRNVNSNSKTMKAKPRKSSIYHDEDELEQVV
jgi:hypothetical protein